MRLQLPLSQALLRERLSQVLLVLPLIQALLRELNNPPCNRVRTVTL
jgi:hypothetical protein